MPEAQDPLPFQVRSGGIGLEAVRWDAGPRARALVCLVHGFSEHGRRYDHVARALRAAGISAAALDLRGHGRSPGRRGHIADYGLFLEDLSAYLRRAREFRPDLPVFLHGHSLGGNLVLNFALRRPGEAGGLRGLMVTSPWLRLAHPPPAWKLAMGACMRRLWPAYGERASRPGTRLSHDQAAEEAFRRDPLNHDRISAGLFFAVREAGAWALEHAGELSTPTLLLHGEADNLTDCSASREFAARAGTAVEFRGWPGLYHELHNEAEPHRGQVLAAMLAWLGRRLDAPALASPGGEP